MSHEIEKEIAFWNRNNLVSDLHKQTHPFHRLESKSCTDRLTEVLGTSTRIHFESLICVVGEVHLMENGDLLVLNGFHFNQVWRILALTISNRFRKSCLTICSEGLSSSLHAEEHVQFFKEHVTASKATTTKPQQLPSSFFTLLVAIVCQLLEKLTINFITECFLCQWMLHNSVGKLSGLTSLVTIRQITHVLHDSLIDLNGLVVEILVGANLLQKGLFERIPRKAPLIEGLLALFTTKCSRHRLFRRWTEMVHSKFFK
mmetsp:Transcript_125381/g.177029  ORF Transcript_125381/g.177029 Transcript_125381/m.177029 type:complete len:259 (+) Transcript_125381:804-1580(+)